MTLINICHIFLYSRILELIDTVWIILRKKNRQITFLHVFHHSFVLLMTWFYFKIAPGGSSAMFPIVNGIVHSVMYTYYILSTFETIKPYLWWKKYVTTIQLIQFIILGVHFSAAALTPNCQYPRILSLTGLAIAGMFFSLFIAFYRETYLQNQRNLQNQKNLKLQEKRNGISKTERDREMMKALLASGGDDNNNSINDNNNIAEFPNYNAKLSEAKNR